MQTIFLLIIASFSFARAYTEKDRTCKNMVCYQLYDPICAINHDKQTADFANRCFMDIANCPLSGNKKFKFLHEGKCKGGKQCREIRCTEQYQPVCAQNNSKEKRTFSNSCEMERVNCPLPEDKKFKILFHRECHRLSDETQQDCHIACTKEYMPICGINSLGEEKTFANNCTMTEENCPLPKEKQYKKLHNFECESRCEEISCFAIYDPVCGANTNGEKRTFGNICELNKANCNIEYKFYFSKNGCCNSLACPYILDPICGADSLGSRKTFDSQCRLDAENCEKNSDFRKILNGKCPRFVKN